MKKRFQLVLTLNFTLLPNGDDDWNGDIKTSSRHANTDVRDAEQQMIEAGIQCLRDELENVLREGRDR